MTENKCTTKNCGGMLGSDDLLFCFDCRQKWVMFCKVNMLVNPPRDEISEKNLHEALEFFQKGVMETL